MKNLLFIALLFVTLFSVGCGGDDDGDGPAPGCTEQAYTQAVSNAVTELSSAASAFANDPSTANCNAWKTAAQNYLDEVKRFENCATLNTRDDFRDSIRNAEEAVAMTSC